MVDAPQITEEQRKAYEEKIKNMSPEELRQLQKQQCIFCQIISGKIPSKKIFEDPRCLAVLDINPATRGHLLLLPKEHYSIMPQVPAEELSHLFSISKLLSRLQLRALKVSGTNIFIANGPAAGQRAQHFMIHLIPRKEGDNLLPSKDKLIDPALMGKVKDVVQDRLLELLGKAPSGTNGKDTSSGEAEEEMIKDAVWKEQPSEQKKEETTKTKKPSKPRAKKKKEPEEEVEEEQLNPDPSATLDEIAELFK